MILCGPPVFDSFLYICLLGSSLLLEFWFRVCFFFSYTFLVRVFTLSSDSCYLHLVYFQALPGSILKPYTVSPQGDTALPNAPQLYSVLLEQV